jgi:hypothetical protein
VVEFLTSLLTKNTTTEPMPTPPTEPRARRKRLVVLGLAVAIAGATAAPGVTDARSNAERVVLETPAPPDEYVTTTTSSTPSLDVSAFTTECVRDAPYIRYVIVPVGFTPIDGSATLVIRAANGTVVETTQVTSLSGQLIWPGAVVDPAGNTIDWPGWKRSDDGVSWILDPTDAFLRDGLTIEVTVKTSATSTVAATATVTYPPNTLPCANPPGPNRLSDTGGEPGNVMIIGAAALLSGMLLVVSARRRRRGVILTAD